MHRLRVGNYRVLYNWDGAINVVEIEEVRKRNDARTNIEVINGPQGKPAYVVIPYAEYVTEHSLRTRPDSVRSRA
jgi:hypothetical protein